MTGTPRDAADFFEVHGYAGPFPAWSAREMREVARRLSQDVATPRAAGSRRELTLAAQNRHLDSPIVAALCRHPAIFDRLEALLGPDPVLWRSHVFTMPRGVGLPWHQDRYSNFIDPRAQQVAVHLAITPATSRSCVAILPGSQLLSHGEIERRFGLRLLGDTVTSGYGTPRFEPLTDDPPGVRRMTLRPGEFFLFHASVLHTSQLRAGGPRQFGNPSREAIGRRRHRRWIRRARLRPANPVPRWLRMATSFRLTADGEAVHPLAFQETQPRGDHCVPLLRGSGHTLQQAFC